MVMTGWMIEIDDVAKSFGDVAALKGVSFVAGAGEVVGLLGPNGAGKTTLVRILATLQQPDRGAVRIGGIDVATDAGRARQLIGLAGQVAAVDELLTGRENLELMGALYGVRRAECRERAHELLARLDLIDAADRRVGTYSGGMRRRLDLGATLIGRPAVVLLDEPTAGLDPRSRNELWALVSQIAADGTTILLTSQYLEEVERLADRIVVLHHGELLADAPPSDLKQAIRAETSGGLLESTVVAEAAAVLADAGILVADLALPSLDDVFLALTGDATMTEPIVVTRGEPPGARAPITAATPRPLRDMATVTSLYLRRFARVPQILFFSALQPLFFVLGLNAAFGGLVEGATGTRYIQYLLPGVVVMQQLFSGGVTSAGLAGDMQTGIIDRFRSLPMSRAAVLVGRTSADLVRNAIGLAVAVGTGYALGFRFAGSGADAVACLALLLAFSYASSWLFACIGLAVKDPQAAQLAGFLPSLPMVYLSGAWVPVESMQRGLQVFARNQPVNVLIATMRSLAAGEAAPVAGQALAWTAVLLVVSVPLARRLYGGRARA